MHSLFGESLFDVFKELVEKKEVVTLQKNDAFVFFKEPECSKNLSTLMLDARIMVGKSGKILFVLN